MSHRHTKAHHALAAKVAALPAAEAWRTKKNPTAQDAEDAVRAIGVELGANDNAIDIVLTSARDAMAKPQDESDTPQKVIGTMLDIESAWSAAQAYADADPALLGDEGEGEDFEGGELTDAAPNEATSGYGEPKDLEEASFDNADDDDEDEEKALDEIVNEIEDSQDDGTL